MNTMGIVPPLPRWFSVRTRYMRALGMESLNYEPVYGALEIRHRGELVKVDLRQEVRADERTR